jgi:hypothetical protein
MTRNSSEEATASVNKGTAEAGMASIAIEITS